MRKIFCMFFCFTCLFLTGCDMFMNPSSTSSTTEVNTDDLKTFDFTSAYQTTDFTSLEQTTNTIFTNQITDDQITTTEIFHTVTFNVNGGVAIGAITVKSGETIELNPTMRVGYNFLGWFLSEDLSGEPINSITVDSDIVLYAKWEDMIEKVTVTFETFGGSLIEPIELIKSSYLSFPQDPIKSGFVFGGWFLEPNYVTEFKILDRVYEDITLYAFWIIEEPETVRVSFKTGFEGVIEDMIVEINTILSELPQPLRTRYNFLGWFIDQALTIPFNINQPITQDTVLYAKWSGPIIYSYLVSFETNGAQPLESIYVIENTLLSYVDIVRIGYTFDGWFTDIEFNNPFDFSTKINQDYQLYAKWLINSYTLFYDTNGGDELDEQSYDYNENLSLLTPTRNGMDFAGWYLDKELTIKFDATNMPDYNLVLFAKWSSLISDFSYDVHEDYVEITGYTGMANEVFIPEMIAGLEVTHIADNAFLNNLVIEKVYIENNITYIGSFAFAGAANLKTLMLPTGIYDLGVGMLSGVVGIEILVISSELEYNLEHIFGTIEDIPEHSFVIKFANGSNVIKNNLINSNLKNAIIELSDDTLIIDFSLFKDNSYIKHLVIPNGVTTIDDYAFENMTALESIVLPDSINLIGTSIFRGSSSIESITTPFVGKTRTSSMKEGVLGYFFSQTSYDGSTLVKQKDGSTIIDGVSFYISSSLREVIITDADILQYGTFNNVVFLERIVLSENLTTIGRYSLANAGVKNIDIPASVTLIDRFAFYGSQALESVAFSSDSNLDKVDNSAFSNCLMLRSIVFPDGLTTIGQEVFRYSNNLKYVYIPDSVNRIGSLSFSNLDYTVIYTEASSNKPDWMVIPIKVFYDVDEIVTEDDFVYAISTDYALIIDYFGVEVNLVIPNTFNGFDITGIMDNTFRELLSLESIVFATGSKVEIIGSYAFYNCENLMEILLPDALIEINSYAFYGTELTEINIGNTIELIDDYAFYLTNLSILEFEDNSNLQIIGEKAFYALNLIEVEIPASVIYIDVSAFAFNTQMTSFSFEAGTQIEIIPDYMLYKNSLIVELVLPKSVQIIGYGSFSFITNLTTFTFEENSELTLIDNMAFAECVNLVSIVIPEPVIAINENAFNNCVSLSELIFLSMENLNHIGSEAFQECVSLVNVVLPDSVLSIDSRVFYNCINLVSINIPNNLEVISVETFYRTAVTDIHIPNSVTEILQYAFGGAGSLVNVSFEENSSLVSIGQFAFTGTGIKEITIPSSVETIGRNVISPNLEKLYFEDNSKLTVIVGYTFYNNPNLAIVELPDGLLEIGYSAFGCYAPQTTFGHIYNNVMESIYIPQSVIKIEAQAFRNVMNLTIYTSHASKPVGWHDDFNLRTSTTYHEVVYGS